MNMKEKYLALYKIARARKQKTNRQANKETKPIILSEVTQN